MIHEPSKEAPKKEFGYTKTSFTPGPWKLEQIANQEVDISGKCGTFLGLNPGSGAPFRLDADDHAEFVANAHLIAAAPNLYAALELLYHHATLYMEVAGNVMQDVLSALAKARGEQP
jgi:hypothetical protein